MHYPCLRINLDHLKRNCQTLIKLCESYHITPLGVCKAVVCDPHIVKTYQLAGIKAVGDSRIDNLKKISHLNIEKWLIRMPMISQISEVVQYCDVSLQTELQTIQLMHDYCVQTNQYHEIILMLDVGDLREGFFETEELIEAIDYVQSLSHIHLKGIGTNLACLSFVLPDHANMEKLAAIARLKNIDFISGGNSASLAFMMANQMPKEINHIRLGEALLIGKERCTYQYLPHTYQDTFLLEAEIIECKNKPSYPIGKINKNSYGELPSFEDHGIEKRAILAIGHQDIDDQTMFPLDSMIRIIDTSCDHMVVDLSHCQKDYQVGDIIVFRLEYFAIMRAFTSPYIKKMYIEEENTL